MPDVFAVKTEIGAREETMGFSEGKNRISQRVAMAIVVPGLVAFACLTGCSSSGRHTKAIAVVDSANNRMLVYNYPITANGQAANGVLGEPDFVSSAAVTTATGMNDPSDAAQDSAGNLYVVDFGNHRVLQYKPPFTNGMAASVVFGQPDFVTAICTTTQNGLCNPNGAAFDHSGNLWVADFGNSRILKYVPPFATGMNASLVIGQPDFTTSGGTTTSTGLAEPEFIAFDGSGNLWTTDTFNNRVLKYVPPFTTAMAASLVIGQTDFVSSGVALTASGLDFPTGIAFDRAGNLWVGDSGNSRVLAYVPAFATGMSATLVLGQPDFVTAAFNITQNGFGSPFGLDFDSKGNLVVADLEGNRTMAFKPPFTTDQLAVGVLGQPDFVTSTATTTAVGQDHPFSVRALYRF
jgi:sugar lactone lactonase YvrE